MNHASLFTGIGGFDLAAQWMGWTNVFQVEIDKFCTRVLEKNFPGVKRYGDIKQFDGREYAGQIDILTGGFPCQPFSVAGKRKGNQDDRFLWDQMLRVISEIQPAWIIAENVGGIITQERGLVFEQVCSEMEKEGYEVQPFIIPACATNAPHRRDRVWFVAHSNGFSRFGHKTKQSEETNFKSSIGNSIGWHSNVTYATVKGFQEREQSGESSTPEESETGLVNRTADINSNATNTNGQGSQRHRNNGECGGECTVGQSSWEASWVEVATELCRVDDGIPAELHIIKRIEYDQRSNQKSDSEINYIIWKVLRVMWEQKEFATTSPDIYIDRLYNSLYEMPRESGSGTWIEAYKKDKKLCSLWEEFYSLSYEEAQDLQRELLVNLRAYKCSKEMGQKDRVERLKALGNSIVPQVAYEIFKAIEKVSYLP